MILPPTARGLRFDRAICEALVREGVAASMREVRRAVKAGEIRIDGKRAAPGRTAAGGELIELGAFVARSAAEVLAEPDLALTIAILHQDSTRLALDKPSGMATQPLRGGERGSLLGAAIAIDPAVATAGPALEGGLVHRLDRGTSGVVLFARDGETRHSLRTAFKDGLIEKRYLALVFDPARRLAAGAVIDRPIAPASDPSMVRALLPGSLEGLAARSEIVSVRPLEDGFAWVEVRARTGRRHQIRAHLAAEGAPLAGDPHYGSAPSPAGLARLALHAFRLVLPGGLTIEAPLPAELARALEALG